MLGDGAYANLDMLSELQWTSDSTDCKAVIADLRKRHADLKYEAFLHRKRNKAAQGRHGRWRKFFKITLIMLTFLIAAINLLATGSLLSDDTVQQATLLAGLLAISSSTIATLDGFFDHSGRLSDARLKEVRASAIVRSADAMWDIHVTHLGTSYKAYRNAVQLIGGLIQQLQTLEQDAENESDKKKKPGKNGENGGTPNMPPAGDE